MFPNFYINKEINIAEAEVNIEDIPVPHFGISSSKSEQILDINLKNNSMDLSQIKNKLINKKMGTKEIDV